MVDISPEIYDIVNKPGRVGVLGTADKDGQPNVAYFGSLRLLDDGTVALGMAPNRSLENLKQNPKAVLFCVTESPVNHNTVGIRLYLNVREIQAEGPFFEAIKNGVRQNAGERAAKMIAAAVGFDIVDMRPLVDFRGK